MNEIVTIGYIMDYMSRIGSVHYMAFLCNLSKASACRVRSQVVCHSIVQVNLLLQNRFKSAQAHTQMHL